MKRTGKAKEDMINFRIGVEKKRIIKEILREKNTTLTKILMNTIDKVIASEHH